MSSAAATADAAPAKGSKKKLFIIIGAVVLLLVLGGGAALFMMSKKAAAGDEEGGEAHAEVEKPKAKEKDKEHAAPPTFVPLDIFTVNLADTNQDRYLQVAMQLELHDAHAADQVKAYMPAIRNAVLLILSRKTSEELLTAEGKTQLADEIRVGAARAMGLDVEDESADTHADEAPAGKKKKKKRSADENPIFAVHYANFIIQ